MAKYRYYNKTDTCEICGKDFCGRALKEYKNKKETGRWICESCYGYIKNYGTDCASEDGKNIERIYEIPKSEITIRKTGINILKYDSKGNLYNKGWYEKYRVTDEEEIKKVYGKK